MLVGFPCGNLHYRHSNNSRGRLRPPWTPRGIERVTPPPDGVPKTSKRKVVPRWEAFHADCDLARTLHGDDGVMSLLARTAAIHGEIRRVVFNTASCTIDLGRASRLFTGLLAARD